MERSLFAARAGQKAGFAPRYRNFRLPPIFPKLSRSPKLFVQHRRRNPRLLQLAPTLRLAPIFSLPIQRVQVAGLTVQAICWHSLPSHWHWIHSRPGQFPAFPRWGPLKRELPKRPARRRVDFPQTVRARTCLPKQTRQVFDSSVPQSTRWARFQRVRLRTKRHGSFCRPVNTPAQYCSATHPTFFLPPA